MNDFETLKKMTGYIKNKELKSLVDRFLEEKIPDYFLKIPASSTGKCHPSYTLGEGGLVRHTIAAVKIANYLMSIDCSIDVLGLSAEDMDNVIAALILHDSFKQGIVQDGYTVKDHALIAAEQVKEAFGETPIYSLILTHMGQWGDVKPRSIPESIVHFADYLASRKTITVDVAGVA